MAIKLQWDIFCAVVDNFGDIGICWRLSRQLVAEHGQQVRLWVDDLASFKQLCHELDSSASSQQLAGVQICHWQPNTDWQQFEVAQVVVEALACTIPLPYQQQMAKSRQPLIWLNLEYLSAEPWIEGCHTLASPQPHLPLTKYFFFPGFTKASGGLLFEPAWLLQLQSWQQDHSQHPAFWQQLGIADAANFACKVSLFAYSHCYLAQLLQYWQQGEQRTLCLVPPGELATQLQASYPELVHSSRLALGQLTLVLMPFIAQPDYDKLLHLCDINFVRGEDSIIRAQWAKRPFIWQIYRQAEQAHLLKLNAFSLLYCQQLNALSAAAVQQLFTAWNTEQPLLAAWQNFSENLYAIQQHNIGWSAHLQSHGDLASNLVRFAEKKFIMLRNFS
ncbi:elongation factor P maturation arginine rhamnosyltransferase EarP [Arsukibacterium sp.]|uniref:elongation factor P maturation arginine rhamnosyltransferase EarP n=1 Tax=Arsukibacterium sp. TaxID=1977258 RepID=UPI002FDAAA69